MRLRQSHQLPVLEVAALHLAHLVVVPVLVALPAGQVLPLAEGQEARQEARVLVTEVVPVRRAVVIKSLVVGQDRLVADLLPVEALVALQVVQVQAAEVVPADPALAVVPAFRVEVST